METNWEEEYLKMLHSALRLNDMYKEAIKEKEKHKYTIDKAIDLLNDWSYLDKIDCYERPDRVINILEKGVDDLSTK